jgi:hypothetical protein
MVIAFWLGLSIITNKVHSLLLLCAVVDHPETKELEVNAEDVSASEQEAQSEKRPAKRRKEG